MKLGLQFRLTRGVSSILISDDRQEVVGHLVTEGPFVRQRHTRGFDKRVECVTLLVDEEGEVGNIKKLVS